MAADRRPGSDRQDAVLAPGPVDALVGGDAQAAGDRGARVGRVDDVVELRVTGRDVRIDVGADLLGQLEPLRGALARRPRSRRACLRWMMFTAPSGPITAISAVGQATM